MLNKTVVFMFAIFSTIHAMDLPTFSQPDKNVSIVEFYADTTKKDDQLMYVIKWKTLNAKKVSITFIGEIDKNGSLLVTDKEYHYGPITLTATDEHNQSVSQTINSGEKASPIMNSTQKNSNYRATPVPYRRYPYRRPYRRYY